MFAHHSSFGIITDHDRELYNKVREILYSLLSKKSPESKKNFRIDSHILTRAIAHYVPELVVIDGEFIGVNLDDKRNITGAHTEHSWLLTPDGVIIETFPVGSLVPSLVIIPANGTWSIIGSGHYVVYENSSQSIKKKLANRKTYRKIQALQKCIAECLPSGGI